MNFKQLFGFGPKKPDLGWVTINDLGWQQTERSNTNVRWQDTKHQSLLSLLFVAPNNYMSIPLSNINALRADERKAAAMMRGGLIRYEVIDVMGVKATESISKTPLDGRPNGMSYSGSLVIPFKDCRYVINIVSKEKGITGIRDSAVLDQCLDSGEVTMDDSGLQGWFKDPYLDSFQKGTLMNISEREEYDDKFPDHPLSIVRRNMKIVRESIRFEKDIFGLKPF